MMKTLRSLLIAMAISLGIVLPLRANDVVEGFKREVAIALEAEPLAKKFRKIGKKYGVAPIKISNTSSQPCSNLSPVSKP